MGSNSASTGGGGGGVGPAGVKVTKTGEKKYGTKSSAVAASSRNELRKAVKEFEPLPVKIIKAIAEIPKKSKQNVLDYEGQAAGVTPMRSPTFVPIDNDRNDNNGGNQVVQAPPVATTMPVKGPTETEVSQVVPEVTAEEARARANELISKKKRRGRGRSLMVLTSPQGLTNEGLTLSKKTLLGI